MAMNSIDTWVGGALRRVRNAVAIAELHGDRSPELGPLTRENVEQSIQQALSYGFSVEAIADAAEMDVADIQRLANA